MPELHIGVFRALVMIMASFWRYLAAAQGPFLATIMKLGKPKAFPYVVGAPLTHQCRVSITIPAAPS